MSDNFYSSKRWLRLRRAILERDGWQCQMAKAQGKKVPATAVHHILPRSQYPQYQWEEWNLISLSFAAHNHLHRRDGEQLSESGQALADETARAHGVEGYTPHTTLVIGMPGTGKTTYVKRHMRRGVCYDLDYLAAALRLKEQPKKERNKPAWLIANSLLPGFTEAAHRYTDDVWIIRTAPTEQELSDIKPTEIVVLYGGYGNPKLDAKRRTTLANRIKEAVKIARHTGIKITEINADDY